MRYVYSLLRYTPILTTGEFVNLAAIAVSDGNGDCSIRHVQNDGRARALGTTTGVAAFYTALTQLSQEIDALNDAGHIGDATPEAWLIDRASRARHMVQFSVPAPILATSAEDALDVIFEEMIVDPVKAVRTTVTRSRAISALRSSYKALGAPPSNIRSTVRLETGRITSAIDFAVANGSVLALAHAWSFAVNNQIDLARDIKAWGWSVGELRNSGGSVRSSSGTLLQVANDVPIDVLYVPPIQDSSAEADAFIEATQVFKELEVEARPLVEVGVVADRARSLLSDHGVTFAADQPDLAETPTLY